ncbi:hypothetical protein [Blastochloris tepida]|uniref:Uncharacterized protein n=1 Tax=Blastochloris tepida TaxID=2233851 RepID=A0A348FZC4_9HYPH|nr:hypothetical protein [Blastochloris tepida]BBF92657.1 hypothetical protein BLTE_13420 [Blastochloris tepida]
MAYIKEAPTLMHAIPSLALTRLQLEIAHGLRLWNSIIPKCAKNVGPDPKRPGHTRYLHPTKGWRSVSNKRLGLA